MTLTLCQLGVNVTQDHLLDMAVALNLRVRLGNPLLILTHPPPCQPSHHVVRAWVEDDRLMAEAEEVGP